MKKKMFRTFSCLTALIVFALSCVGCMSDKEWQLRKMQMENQANYPATYDAFTATGPCTIEIKEGGIMRVTVPNQPFKDIPIPDGIKTQEQLIAHLIDIGAISVLGWKALDKASSGKTTNTTTYNNGVTE